MVSLSSDFLRIFVCYNSDFSNGDFGGVGSPISDGGQAASGGDQATETGELSSFLPLQTELCIVLGNPNKLSCNEDPYGTGGGGTGKAQSGSVSDVTGSAPYSTGIGGSSNAGNGEVGGQTNGGGASGPAGLGGGQRDSNIMSGFSLAGYNVRNVSGPSYFGLEYGARVGNEEGEYARGWGIEFAVAGPSKDSFLGTLLS